MATTANALIHGLKLALMSTGVFFIAVLLTPQIFNFTAAQLPSIWTSLQSWLRPPYLYVIINGIIITIAASSRLHHHYTHPHAASPAAADNDQFRHIHNHDVDDHFRSSAAVSVDAYTFSETKAAPIHDSLPQPEIISPPSHAGFDLSSYGATVTFGEEEIGSVERVVEEEEEKAIVVRDYVQEKPRNYDLASVYGGSAEPESVNRRSANDFVKEKQINHDFAPVETISTEPESVNRRSANDFVKEKQRNHDFASVESRSTEPESVNRRSARTSTKPSTPPPQPTPLARQETFDVVSSFFQSQIEKPPASSSFGQKTQNQRPSRNTLSSLDETATFGGVNEVRNHKIDTAPPPPAPLARQETSEIVSSFFQTQIEKPPPSARFGHHRRPTKATPEGGKALKVAKPKRTETLESTWKTITEGRQLPLTRHLKKSDTFENHSRQPDSSDPLMTQSPVKKSETFTDRTNYTAVAAAAATVRLKKDPSLSQDDLNRRVEAFIKKVNEDMKLQRQQSMQQFMDMINRATY